MAYNPTFIPGHTVNLPWLPQGAPAGKTAHYTHHTVIMNSQRKFAWLSACNVDGATWDRIDRTGDFVKDADNLSASIQWGQELYGPVSGKKGPSVFDKGHLTAFQEVLWGDDEEKGKAARDTFFYSNCVPQHSLLNRGAWRSLEQFLIRKGASNQELRISVFTGPVLEPGDPYFSHTIDGEFVRIPTAFWKLIHYPIPDGLQAVAFIMSHRELLEYAGTITFDKGAVSARAADIFMQFPKAATYQVRVDLVAELTGLQFRLTGVAQPYTRKESREIVYKRIEVGPAGDRGPSSETEWKFGAEFELEGVTL